MKMLLLFLSLAMLYSLAQAPLRVKTAIIYQGTAIDFFELNRPRIA